MIILLRGKYVKPLIQLMGMDCISITLTTHGYKCVSSWWYKPSQLLSNVYISKQLIVTKKEYQKLIALIPLVDTPIEAFEMVYGEYFNDNTSSIDR